MDPVAVPRHDRGPADRLGAAGRLPGRSAAQSPFQHLGARLGRLLRLGVQADRRPPRRTGVHGPAARLPAARAGRPSAGAGERRRAGNRRPPAVPLPATTGPLAKRVQPCAGAVRGRRSRGTGQQPRRPHPPSDRLRPVPAGELRGPYRPVLRRVGHRRANTREDPAQPDRPRPPRRLHGLHGAGQRHRLLRAGGPRGTRCQQPGRGPRHVPGHPPPGRRTGRPEPGEHPAAGLRAPQAERTPPAGTAVRSRPRGAGRTGALAPGSLRIPVRPPRLVHRSTPLRRRGRLGPGATAATRQRGGADRPSSAPPRPWRSAPTPCPAGLPPPQEAADPRPPRGAGCGPTFRLGGVPGPRHRRRRRQPTARRRQPTARGGRGRKRGRDVLGLR